MPAKKFTLRLPNSIAKAIRHLHPKLKTRIRQGIQLILQDPYQGKALKDELAELYSFRISRFRIIYRWKGKILEIVAIGPRKNIYQETYRLLKGK